VVHEQTHRSTLIKVGTCLLEKRIHGKFEIELLDLERIERFGQRAFTRARLFLLLFLSIAVIILGGVPIYILLELARIVLTPS
jgi:hypothetical protein